MAGRRGRVASAGALFWLAVVGCAEAWPTGEELPDSGQPEPGLRGDPSLPQCGFSVVESTIGVLLGEHGMVGLSRVFDHPDPFSPNGGADLPVAVGLGVDAFVSSLPGPRASESVDWLQVGFEIADGATCAPLRRLEGRDKLSGDMSQTVTASWDGRNRRGGRVADGIYYYRVTVDLVRGRDGDHGAAVIDRVESEVYAVHVGEQDGMAGRSTRELEARIEAIKRQAADYYDLEPALRSEFDALVRERAFRRGQLLPDQRRLLVGPSSVAASNSSWSSGLRHQAGPVYRRQHVVVRGDASVSGAGGKLFRTAGERGAATAFTPPDPALIVIDEESGESRYADDCPLAAAGRRGSACVSFPATTEGPFTIVMFASPARPLHFGTADVVVDGQLIDHDVEFGGELVDLTTLPDDRVYAFHTVELPDGSDDAQLFLLDADHRLVAADDDSGIERAATLLAVKRPGDQLLVGSWSASTAGPVDVVANECVHDPDREAALADACHERGEDDDRDGLSNRLERVIGTDPEHHDSDRDGLFDYYEVIGRKARDGTEQALRRLGASPLRRDLFLEFDRYAPNDPELAPLDATGELLDESTVRTMRRSLADLPQLPANPDRSVGITLHADIGRPCRDPAVCQGSCATVCGDWGGSQSLALPGYRAEQAIDWFKDYSEHGFRTALAGARQGLFRYVWLIRAGAGQTASATPYSSLRVAGDIGCNAVHELGHTLGLSHAGDPAAAGAMLNFKQTYPSTMNYAYQCSVPQRSDYPRFSEGLLAPVDHRQLSEDVYSPGVDKTHLEASPFGYQIGVRIGFRLYPDSVDWNFDGRIEPGATVAFDTSPIGTPYCGAGWPDLYGARDLGGRIPSARVTGGGALAVVPDPALAPLGVRSSVWAFFPFEDVGGLVYPRWSSIVEDLRTAGRATPDWPSYWSGAWPMDGLASGEVAAVTFTRLSGDRLRPMIVVVFPDARGVLQYLELDPASGEASQRWQPIPGWDGTQFARQASLAVVGDRLWLVYRDLAADDSVRNVYLTTMDRSGNWDAGGPRLQVESEGAARLSSYFTPGVAEAPDGNVYLAILEPYHRQLRFYRRPVAEPDGGWSYLQVLGDTASESIWDGALAATQRKRISLLFLPYLEGGVHGNVPFADGSGYLAAFWNSGNPEGSSNPAVGVPWDDWYPLRAYTTGFLSPTGSNWGTAVHQTYGKPRGVHAQKHARRPIATGSVAVAVRFHQVVEAYPTFDFRDSPDPAHLVREPPLYLPFANGTSPWRDGVNRDNDDAAAIARNLCASVRYLVGSTCQCDAGPRASCAD